MVFIGIHCDDWEEGKRAAEEDSIEYIVANDTEDDMTAMAYEIEGYPTIFVIDKAGKVRYQDPGDLEAVVKELLAE